MKTTEWKTGDLVQLKSGGPTMTVTEIVQEGYETKSIVCTWYLGEEENKRPFHPDTLKAAPTEQ
jgi:uncharacterized protein YodC (DUF2158 family)